MNYKEKMANKTMGLKCPSVCPQDVNIANCLQDYLDSKNASNLDPFFRKFVLLFLYFDLNWIVTEQSSINPNNVMNCS